MSGIASGLQFLYALALMLGVLVTIHEYGHYLVAKWCGVKVLKFSIGFGPPIGFGRFRLAKRIGETEYVIAWFPLGGFVKMQGEEPGAQHGPQAEFESGRSLFAQPLWKKLCIVLAGPAMNLLLPVVVLTVWLGVGIGRAHPVVGTVEPGSPAAAAEMRPGDRILSVAGEPVHDWRDVEDALRARPGQPLALRFVRDGAEQQVALTPQRRAGLDIFFSQSQVGFSGLQHARQRALLNVRKDSPAARAGLRSGDFVLAVGDIVVESWSDFARAVETAVESAESAAPAESGAPGAPGEMQLQVKRLLVEDLLPLQVPLLRPEELGVMPASTMVSNVEPDLPAHRAGLMPGDLILTVNGEPVGSFQTFRDIILASQGRTLRIEYTRHGEPGRTEFAPVLRQAEDPALPDRYVAGISGLDTLLPGVVGVERVLNPLQSVPRAAALSAEMIGIVVEGIWRLLSGRISPTHLGGPIEIARQSQRALQAGWVQFMALLIFISINLGLLNLLPIPVLDGGQALFFLIEGVKRGPLSLRTRLIANQAGLLCLLAIMGFAFWNDISRHWSGFVSWLTGLI